MAEDHKVYITIRDQKVKISDLNRAFNMAENDTAGHFGGRTCSMENQQGLDECPICYFRGRVKHHLFNNGAFDADNT